MNEVTQILSRLDAGDASASSELLPLLYNELRKLAAAKLAQESPGQTLQATALVHEAYLRLIGGNDSQSWDGRDHFFGAAAEAMRRILIERARRKRRLRHGGEYKRVNLDDSIHASSEHDAEMIAVNDLLDELTRQDPASAEVVKLRYFAGFTLEEIADLLQISTSTVKRRWNYARAWLYCRIPPENGARSLK